MTRPEDRRAAPPAVLPGEKGPARPMHRRPRGLRRADEWVGPFVLAAAALFLVAVLQAGVLRD